MGQSAFEALRKLLAYIPGAPVTVGERHNILDLIPTGPHTFPVNLYDQGELCLVAAQRWHAKYDDPEQAAWGALWLLTPFTRVVHETKGGILVSTWLERYEATGWEGMEPVFFLNPEHPGSWKPLGEERYLRRYSAQAVLPSPVPYQEVSPGVRLEDGLPVDLRLGTWAEEDVRSRGLDLY